MVAQARQVVAAKRRGHYESLDYRGESPDGRYAFLLKQVLFRPLWRGAGALEVVLACFDRQTRRQVCVAEREAVSSRHLRQLRHIRQWDDFALSLASGSFIEVRRGRLRGKLHGGGAPASWDLECRAADSPAPAAPGFAWTLPWPRQGVEADGHAGAVRGRVQAGDLVCQGEMRMSSVHYWGDGYPHEFASGHCTRFDGEPGAAFYGCSTRLSLGGLTSPYLGWAALVYRGRRYAFDGLAGSFRHRLEALDNYRWRVTFLSGDLGLEVTADGRNPRLTPWLAWHADHPAGGRSVVKGTPFAEAELVLFHRRHQERIAVLKTGSLMLKTLLPENVPGGSGFLAET